MFVKPGPLSPYGEVVNCLNINTSVEGQLGRETDTQATYLTPAHYQNTTMASSVDCSTLFRVDGIVAVITGGGSGQ